MTASDPERSEAGQLSWGSSPSLLFSVLCPLFPGREMLLTKFLLLPHLTVTLRLLKDGPRWLPALQFSQTRASSPGLLPDQGFVTQFLGFIQTPKGKMT